MMTANGPRLPQELMSLSLTLVDDKDRSVVLDTLCACALAGRALLKASQEILYEGIYLDKPSPEADDAFPSDTRRLYLLLNRSPRLGQYVRRLVIEDSECVEISSGQLYKGTWLNEAEWFTTLLTFFSQVKEVEIYSADSLRSSGIRWLDYSPRVRDALLDLFRRPSVTDLRLSLALDVSLPVDLYEVFHKLTHLTVGPPDSPVSLNSLEKALRNAPEVSRKAKSVLAALSLTDYECFSTLVEWLTGDCSPVRIEELRSLYVYLRPNCASHRLAAPLLEKCKSALVRFVFKPSHEMYQKEVDFDRDPIHLSGFEALRDLQFNVTINHLTDQIGEYIAHVLKTLGAPSILIRLEILVDFDLFDMEGWESSTASGGLGLRAVDNALSNGGFSQLRAVQVTSTMFYGPPYRDVEALVLRELSGMKSRGVLTVNEDNCDVHFS